MSFLNEDSVAVVNEDSVAVVPSKKIMYASDLQPKVGDVVNVTWDDKRQYAATLLMTGDGMYTCLEYII